MAEGGHHLRKASNPHPRELYPERIRYTGIHNIMATYEIIIGENHDTCGIPSQNHAVWWLGNTKSQGISRQVIVKPLI